VFSGCSVRRKWTRSHASAGCISWSAKEGMGEPSQPRHEDAVQVPVGRAAHESLTVEKLNGRIDALLSVSVAADGPSARPAGPLAFPRIPAVGTGPGRAPGSAS